MESAFFNFKTRRNWLWILIAVVSFFIGVSIVNSWSQEFHDLTESSPSSSSSSSSPPSSYKAKLVQLMQSVAERAKSSLTSSKSSENKDGDAKGCASNAKKDKSRQLLLITSGRSGSSFTASIISRSPDVFFTFEPLHVMNGNRTGARSREIVKGFLTCDFSNIPATDLNDIFIVKIGREGRAFHTCQQKNSTGYSHINCLWVFVKYCKHQALRFSKLIRFPMSMVEPLLKDLPNLKVVYLIRDPRAMMYSAALAFGGFDWPILIDDPAKNTCGPLTEDVQEVKRLHHLYPGRLKLVRYEDGVLDSLSYAKDLYDFAGLKFTNDTERYITSLSTGQPKDDKNQYGVRRSDPVKLINRWRFTNGSYESALNIDTFCSDLYTQVGYISVKSKKHLVSETPLFEKQFSFT